jgi:Domain of unknown function (DUF4112)
MSNLQPKEPRRSEARSEGRSETLRQPSKLQAIRAAKMQRLRQLSHLLDDAIKIPGTPYRIGFDPIIGLIPGGGDITGLVMSGFIVLEAAQMGASKLTLATMALNVLLETLAGIVPGIGDIFDATWKSNARNVALLEQHLDLPRPAQNRWFALLLIAGLALMIILCAYLSFRLLQGLFQLVSQRAN